jgi:hypothetical protein
MKELTIYRTTKIGREIIYSIPQKAFKNGKRQVFKSKDNARDFMAEFRAKSTVEW